MFEVATDTDFTTKVYARAGSRPATADARASRSTGSISAGPYYWRAKADDGANSSLFATAQFEVLPKPFVGAPGLVAPVNGDRAASRAADAHREQRGSQCRCRRDRLRVPGRDGPEFRRSGHRGRGRRKPRPDAIRYGCRPDGRSGRTTGACRATDRETTGPWAATQSFRTPVAVATPAPAPSPSPRLAGRAIRVTPRRSSSANARNTGTCRTTRWPRSCAPSPTR